MRKQQKKTLYANLGNPHFYSLPVLVDLREENIVVSVIPRLRFAALILA